jgi:hypothetical protein
MAIPGPHHSALHRGVFDGSGSDLAPGKVLAGTGSIGVDRLVGCAGRRSLFLAKTIPFTKKPWKVSNITTRWPTALMKRTLKSARKVYDQDGFQVYALQ